MGRRNTIPRLDDAVAWIADNDNVGDGDSPDELSTYLTVALVADLFGIEREAVATRVWRRRNP